MAKTTLAFALSAALLAAPAALADIEAGIKAQEDGAFEVALTEFKKDIKGSATRFEANWRTGQTYIMMGNPKEALEYLEKAIEENAAHAEAQYWWGAANGQTAQNASIFSALGYAKKSKKAFEKAVELNPDYLEARGALMQYLLQAPGIAGGDKDEALVQANEIYARDKSKGLVNLIAAHQAREEPAEAMAKADALVELDPNNYIGYTVRGQIHRTDGAMEKAYADFKMLASLTGTEEDEIGNIKFGNYYLAAVASKGKIHVAEGIEAMTGFLSDTEFTKPYWENSPLEGYANYYLASLYLQDGNIAAARTSYDIAQSSKRKDKDLKKLLKKFKKALKKAK
ncbi:MAG: tetratricopeptide repeat protein [Kordiimonadaceae bacterium]|nr:tetratricopeptide repeat protein [Kordiimonadaceae bacterium]